MIALDIANRRFSLLVAERIVRLNGVRAWVCRCDCGGTKTVVTGDLMNGRVKSCGCANRDGQRKTTYRNGLSRTRENLIWRGMRQRCNNPKASGYKNYGGRGIKVCARWAVFENFLADMGPCPSDHTIERADNDGDYTPENCRWATRKEQARNRRRPHREKSSQQRR